jgi:lipoprotein-anchoring transpeptidase ErfK/SrfK
VSRVSLIPALAVALALVAAGTSPAKAPGANDMAVSERGSWAAKVMATTKARSKPGFDKEFKALLRTQSSWSGGAHQLLVLRSVVVEGQRWLKVRLPKRPNNSSAWLPANRTRLLRNPWRVHVQTERRVVNVYRGGRRVARFRAVIGRPSTPTPKGLFAVYERVRQANPSGFLGPVALHLTSHSEVLRRFGGGPGRIAIHGRGDTSLLDPLGTARSNGCLRINNSKIEYLAKRLPLGTPVWVR